ncbi:Pyridoxamine 5'-phosphate oxidase [Cognatiyoonia koreensis]|uniref:Pyridoxamine 5'-phosphate oxidase n=1 Tax=Cognatiyoonia koreensis TaxID=364200 RepID=A0A1I0RVN6_9RHOB|nr:pyridoxamine 5'-phosphate oxidase family protein [Cognatiyoonia koreensis]SEW45468.1 Pyridoxamine 5'-phosphate oxidase [Cognatiyoonia koreensis]
MSDWFKTLDGIHDRIWQTLGRGVADRKHVARTPTFTTVRDGKPEARTIVLRAADPKTHALDVHTDLGTAKVASLRQSPHATFHIWDQKQRLQIRLLTTVDILTGDAVADIWANVPDPAREVYGTRPSPGTVIPDALDYKKPADFESFAVLRCAISEIDALHLGDEYRRAAFARSRDWQGQWLAP